MCDTRSGRWQVDRLQHINQADSEPAPDLNGYLSMLHCACTCIARITVRFCGKSAEIRFRERGSPNRTHQKGRGSKTSQSHGGQWCWPLVDARTSCFGWKPVITSKKIARCFSVLFPRFLDTRPFSSLIVLYLFPLMWIYRHTIFLMNWFQYLVKGDRNGSTKE